MGYDRLFAKMLQLFRPLSPRSWAIWFYSSSHHRSLWWALATRLQQKLCCVSSKSRPQKALHTFILSLHLPICHGNKPGLFCWRMRDPLEQRQAIQNKGNLEQPAPGGSSSWLLTLRGPSQAQLRLMHIRRPIQLTHRIMVVFCFVF